MQNTQSEHHGGELGLAAEHGHADPASTAGRESSLGKFLGKLGLKKTRPSHSFEYAPSRGAPSAVHTAKGEEEHLGPQPFSSPKARTKMDHKAAVMSLMEAPVDKGMLSLPKMNDRDSAKEDLSSVKSLVSVGSFGTSSRMSKGSERSSSSKERDSAKDRAVLVSKASQENEGWVDERDRNSAHVEHRKAGKEGQEQTIPEEATLQLDSNIISERPMPSNMKPFRPSLPSPISCPPYTQSAPTTPAARSHNQFKSETVPLSSPANASPDHPMSSHKVFPSVLYDGLSPRRKGRFGTLQRSLQKYLKLGARSPRQGMVAQVGVHATVAEHGELVGPSEGQGTCAGCNTIPVLPPILGQQQAVSIQRQQHVVLAPDRLNAASAQTRPDGHTATTEQTWGADATLHPVPPATAPTPQPERRIQVKNRRPESNLIAISENLPPGMRRDVWCFEDYKSLQKIHSGYASSVYKALCRLSGECVVLKVYKPSLLHVISQHQLKREARIHATLDHPHIICMYAAFEQEDSVVLVEEYADGGDLLQLLLKNNSRLGEKTAIELVVQPILLALCYLHEKAIAHRDVKLENILFAHGGNKVLKLADFGLCINLREERSVTRAGTLDYMAPEVLQCPTKSTPEENKERLELSCTVQVDIWAMAVMIYEVLNGVPPFTRQVRKDTERVIKKAVPPDFLVSVSPQAKEFVHSCFAKDPMKRPTAWQLADHPWAAMPPQVRTPKPPTSSKPSGSSIVPLSKAASTPEPHPVPLVENLPSQDPASERALTHDDGQALPHEHLGAVHQRHLAKSTTAPSPHAQPQSSIQRAAEAAVGEEEGEGAGEERSSAPAAPVPFESRAAGPQLDTIAETVREMVLNEPRH